MYVLGAAILLVEKSLFLFASYSLEYIGTNFCQYIMENDSMKCHNINY